MSVAMQQPWTAERFLAWAEAQDAPYEFDGTRPVAMTGGNVRHDNVTFSLNLALRSRLRGKPCSAHGPNLGIETMNGAIRYPDALVTCANVGESAKLAPEPVVVFEVVSPTSGRTDRIAKLREYEGVPSILRYVIVETRSAGATILYRADGSTAFTASALTADDVLRVPEAGIELPVAALYEDVTFDQDDDPTDI